MKSKGPGSWKDIEPPGRPSKLTEKQQQRLKEILIRGPLARGYLTDLWTLKRVAEVVEKEFGVRYNVTHVWRVLRDLGFSAQVPLMRARERKEEIIQEWVQREWPRIVLQARETDATIYFLDESAVQSRPNVRRTWALRGKRWIMKAKERREKLSLISAVSIDGDLYFRVHEENITGTDVLMFLRYLLREVPDRIMLLWYNGAIHRRKDVKQFLYDNRERLFTRRFPPYAPELNPDEQIWNILKHQELPNWCPDTKDEMKHTVSSRLRQLQWQPARVRVALHASELPLPVNGYLGRRGL